MFVITKFFGIEIFQTFWLTLLSYLAVSGHPRQYWHDADVVGLVRKKKYCSVVKLSSIYFT